jgi:hypothetical protein
MTKRVKNIMFDLEHPIFEARSLAHALTMMAWVADATQAETALKGPVKKRGLRVIDTDEDEGGAP